MTDGNPGNGVFLVKLIVGGGPRVEVRFTGEHFRPDEIGIAKAVAVKYGSASVANGGSPVYLVRDSVVRLAMMSRNRALRAFPNVHRERATSRAGTAKSVGMRKKMRSHA